MKLLKSLFLIATLVFSINSIHAITPDQKVYGVTLDGYNNLSAITTALSNHCKKMTARIVFDEWVPATTYVTPCSQIHSVANVMGELLDSYYMSQYSYDQYVSRVNEYMNTVSNNVDIWEIGNEVNGEWCGPLDSVVHKITTAYQIAKSHSKIVSLTLYYNYNCWANAQNEMFRWVNQKCPQHLRLGVDYLLVSYYEDDCNGYQPNWNKVFDSLHVLFPHAKLGMGECGTATTSNKALYITRYYTMNVTTPRYIGGYFWWYYKEDCIPNTLSLWTTLNNAIEAGPSSPVTQNAQDSPIITDNVSTKENISISPNPFNPTTKISYSLPQGENVRIKIYDVIGREVKTLVDGYNTPGSYQVTFDGSNLASGIYICRLETGTNISVQKLILTK